MHVKIIFTKMSSGLKQVFENMIHSLGAVAVKVEGGQDQTVVRHIARHIRGDGELLKESTEKSDLLCRKTLLACEPCEKTPHTA